MILVIKCFKNLKLYQCTYQRGYKREAIKRETILYNFQDELLSRRPNDRHAILGGTVTKIITYKSNGELYLSQFTIFTFGPAESNFSHQQNCVKVFQNKLGMGPSIKDVRIESKILFDMVKKSDSFAHSELGFEWQNK